MASIERSHVPERRHVVLVGLPGAGKTSVGQVLAGLSGRPFVDIDCALREAAPQSDDLITAGDWASFRALEADVAKRALATDTPSVIAFGGGTLLSAAVRDAALKAALVVYLDEEPRLLSQRLAASPRRMFDGQDIERALIELHRQRCPIYAQAQVRIHGQGRPIEALAAAVLEKWGDFAE